jgi:hypothetical protein
MTRAQQNIGKHGETLAASVLSGLGVEMIERIGTPVSLVPHPHIPGYFRVIYAETVSGDHRGILPGGRSVLVEVKTIVDRNLRYSDLRTHQPDRLSEHANHGGLSVLVWVHGSGVYPMIWPVSGFYPGKSLNVVQAAQRMIFGLDLRSR